MVSTPSSRHPLGRDNLKHIRWRGACDLAGVSPGVGENDRGRVGPAGGLEFDVQALPVKILHDRSGGAGLLAVQRRWRLRDLLLLDIFRQEEVGIGLGRDLDAHPHALGRGVAGAEFALGRIKRPGAVVGRQPELPGTLVEIQPIGAGLADGLGVGVLGEGDDLAADVVNGPAGRECTRAGATCRRRWR